MNKTRLLKSTTNILNSRLKYSRKTDNAISQVLGKKTNHFEKKLRQELIEFLKEKNISFSNIQGNSRKEIADNFSKGLIKIDEAIINIYELTFSLQNKKYEYSTFDKLLERIELYYFSRN